MEIYFAAVGALSNDWEKRIRFADCNYVYDSYSYRRSSLSETKTPSVVRSGNLRKNPDIATYVAKPHLRRKWRSTDLNTIPSTA